MKCKITIKADGDVMEALLAALKVVKALGLENMNVDCGDGIFITASKDSYINDLYSIYRLMKKAADATPTN